MLQKQSWMFAIQIPDKYQRINSQTYQPTRSYRGFSEAMDMQWAEGSNSRIQSQWGLLVWRHTTLIRAKPRSSRLVISNQKREPTSNRQCLHDLKRMAPW